MSNVIPFPSRKKSEVRSEQEMVRSGATVRWMLLLLLGGVPSFSVYSSLLEQGSDPVSVLLIWNTLKTLAFTAGSILLFCYLLLVAKAIFTLILFGWNHPHA